MLQLNIKSLLTTLCLTTGLCVLPATVQGLIVSVKTTGMAATGIAYPQDALAGAFNPAGNADIPDRLDFGVTWAQDRDSTRIYDSPVPGIDGHFEATRTKDFYAPDFGINKTLPCDMSIGYVVYNRSFSKTTYKHPLPLLGTSDVGMEFLHQTASFIWAMKFCERHNIGVSANLNVQRIKVNGLQNFDNALLSASPGNVTNRGYNYSSGWGVTVGYRGQWTDWLSVGATYQPETHMKRFDKYAGFLARHGKFNIPQKIGFGVAINLCDLGIPSVIAFDIENIRWKQIPALKHPIHPGIDVAQLGSNLSAGFGWRNQTFYRIGIDYQLTECWTIRAGYRHADGLVKPSQTAVNLLLNEVNKNFFTCGFTYAADECNEFSGFYAHGFTGIVKGKNAIPVAVAGGAVELGGGGVNLKQSKDAFGISWGHLF